MKYIIRGKNIDVTDAIREYINNRLEKITKYKIVDINDTIHIDIRTYRENLTRIKVMLDLKGKNNFLQADAHHEDLYVAIDSVHHKLEEQLRRMKDRWIPKGREKFSKIAADHDDIMDEDI